MTKKADCPDAFTEDEPDDATFCDGYMDEGCSYTSSPDEFIHVGDKDYCFECWAKIRRENLCILPKKGAN